MPIINRGVIKPFKMIQMYEAAGLIFVTKIEKVSIAKVSNIAARKTENK